MKVTKCDGDKHTGNDDSENNVKQDAEEKQQEQQQQQRKEKYKKRTARVKHRQPSGGGGDAALWFVVGGVVVLLAALMMSSQALVDHWRSWGEEATTNPAPLEAPPPPMYRDIPGREGGRGNNHQPSSCYTLEAYSMKFIAPGEKKKKLTPQAGGGGGTLYFYRCGTRLMDLTTEVNHSKVELCKTATEKQGTLFPTLRVYLAGAAEEKAHLQQQQNLGAQNIPLHRVNDDYCDCLDGTDELQTNACSMSGVAMPLGYARWKQYVTVNSHVSLYEEEEAPSLRRTERLFRRTGGPVLPFICRGDPDVWLAPSRVGDNVVDCCDGSDEEKNEKELNSKWNSRVDAMKQYLDMDNGIKNSLLYPTDRGSNNYTVAAMLLEKEYTSLMTCRRVKEERLRHARLLHSVVERGHTLYKERKLNGWEVYGKSFVEQSTRLQKEAQVKLKEFEEQRKRIRDAMTEFGTDDPIAANISTEELKSVTKMYAELQQDHMRLRHMQMMLGYRWLGDNFEYYPLADARFVVPWDRVVDTARSSSLRIQHMQAARRYNDTYIFEAPPMHVDNTSYREFSFVPYLYIVGIRNFTQEQIDVFIQRTQMMDEEKILNVSTLQDIQRGPPVMFGFWQPDHSEVSLDEFTSIDPSGSTILRQRLFMNDASPIIGGVEQILPFERLSYGGRHARRVSIENYDSMEKLRRARDGKDEEKTMKMPQRHNTADLAAVQVFSGGIACALDNDVEGIIDEKRNDKNNNTLKEDKEKEENEMMHLSYGHVVYVCADEDNVLAWHRNGKCAHEVVLGTPSACPPWVMERAERRLRRAEDALQLK